MISTMVPRLVPTCVPPSFTSQVQDQDSRFLHFNIAHILSPSIIHHHDFDIISAFFLLEMLSSTSNYNMAFLHNIWHLATPPPCHTNTPSQDLSPISSIQECTANQDFASTSSCIASGYLRCSADSRRPTMCVTRQSFPVWLLYILLLSEIESIPSIIFESFFQYSTFTFNTSIEPGDPICSGIPLLQL
jgi:hypothetical protein